MTGQDGTATRVVIVGGGDAGIEAARRCLELNRDVDVRLLVADTFPAEAELHASALLPLGSTAEAAHVWVREAGERC